MRAGVLVLTFMVLWSSPEASVGPEKLQNAITAFSTDLFKELTKGEAKNLIVSPVSVSILLAMLLQGARGSTTHRLKEALRLDSIVAKELYGALVKHYQKDLSGTNTTLELSNSLFLNSGYQVIPEFKNTLVQSFLSDVERVAFGTGEGLRAVNGWASRATHGKIETILDKEPKRDTALILANAIYFKSPWQMPFSNLETREGDFTVKPGLTVKVPFMHAVLRQVHITESKELDAKLLMLPFKGQRFSLLMILSNKKNGLQQLISQLTPSNVMRMILPNQPTAAKIKIPRFKLESKLELEKSLRQLGLGEMFDKPDFSGISTSGPSLQISEVIQKATVEIDEQGGEASVITVSHAIRVEVVPKLEFEADHPFVAMIVDHEKKIPLFMITVADPSKEG